MSDGWENYSKLVLSKIDDLSLDHKVLSKEVTELKYEIQTHLSDLRSEVSVLKTKAALWGSLSGAIIGGVISHFFKGFGK